MSKIYGNAHQYDKLWVYVAKAMPSYLDYFLLQQYSNNTESKLIAELSSEADVWLKKHCSFEWAVLQIKTE